MALATQRQNAMQASYQSQAGSRPQTARVGCVQWQMRSAASPEELLRQAEGFVRSLAGYQCDVALFPEFFTTPLMALAPGLPDMEAMRELARHTPMLVEAFSRMAEAHHINIIAGSMPLMEDGQLYNVAYLCRRDGRVDTQYKLHPTPGEKRDWDMQGGNRLASFDTDIGRIGILICYDVEFPELPRLLAAEGMDILFVPFWTDTRNGYLRVRHCAQARAIENECYVALAGSVGYLPEVSCLDAQYAQSAVFSPSDFGFPQDAILAEATPNTEMSLIVDLDLAKLERVRREGSVRNGQDQRRDLYRVEWLGRERPKSS